MTARRSHAAWAWLLAAGLLAGCSKPADSVGSGDPATVAAHRPDDADAAAPARHASLAITRKADLALDSSRIAPLFNATLAACSTATADACVVLESSLSTGTSPHAELKLRAAPAGIARILATLRTGNGLVSESASAADLAAPIADVERRLAMQRDYRDSLLALRARGGNDITALMKISQELARVQGELEAATGERANMQQRLDTETLTVSMSPTGEESHAFWPPVAQSLHRFGDHLSEAAAEAITFIAFLVPWAVVLLPLAWLARRLWRFRRRKP